MTDVQPSEYSLLHGLLSHYDSPCPQGLVIVAALKLESNKYGESPIQNFKASIGLYCEARVFLELSWMERSCSGDRGSARFNASAGHVD